MKAGEEEPQSRAAPMVFNKLDAKTWLQLDSSQQVSDDSWASEQRQGFLPAELCLKDMD